MDGALNFPCSWDPIDGYPGFNGFLSASLISVLSLQDYLSGNTTFKQVVGTSIQVYGQQHPNYFYLDP